MAGKVIYTAEAHVVGGRTDGHGRTSDGVLEVDLTTTEDRAFEVGVRLNVNLPDITDAEQAKMLVAAAHQVCPYSRATRGNIDVELSANGEPVD